jgi:Fe-S cluster biogenesis protein NfuA
MPKSTPQPLSPQKATERIEKILTKIRPYVQMHGGDVMLLKYEVGTVTLKVYGSCVGCPMADLTYNKMVGGLLKEEVPGVKHVVFE